MAASALAEQDRVRWIVEELDALAPQPGEWETVQAEHKRLSHAAGLLEGVQAAVDALAESDASALSQVGNVSARLAQLVPYDERLQPAVELLDAAQIQLDEAVAALRRYLDKTDLDASRLAEVDARLSALHGAARKFKTTPEQVAELLAVSRARLDGTRVGGRPRRAPCARGRTARCLREAGEGAVEEACDRGEAAWARK